MSLGLGWGMDVTVVYLQVSVTYHTRLCPVCHKMTGRLGTVTMSSHSANAAGVHVKIMYN